MAQLIIGDYNSMPQQVQENKENIALLNESIGNTDVSLEEVEQKVQTNTSDIATLKTEVQTNTSDIATLKTEVQTNTSDIATLKTEVQTNTSDIATLKTEVQTNTSDIATLKIKTNNNTSEISQLNNRCDDFDTNINIIQDNIDNIEGELAQLEPTVSAHTNAISDINTVNEQQNEKISALEAIDATKITFKGIFNGEVISNPKVGDLYIIGQTNTNLPTLRSAAGDAIQTTSVNNRGRAIIYAADPVSGSLGWYVVDNLNFNGWDIFTGNQQYFNSGKIIRILNQIPTGTFTDNMGNQVTPTTGDIYVLRKVSGSAAYSWLKLAPYGSSQPEQLEYHRYQITFASSEMGGDTRSAGGYILVDTIGEPPISITDHQDIIGALNKFNKIGEYIACQVRGQIIGLVDSGLQGTGDIYTLQISTDFVSVSYYVIDNDGYTSEKVMRILPNSGYITMLV